MCTFSISGLNMGVSPKQNLNNPGKAGNRSEESMMKVA